MELYIFDFDDTLAITDSRVKIILKKTNEEIYNDLLIRQDPSRITIVAEKQRELEGGEIMFSKEDYLYEYEQARREGNEAKMQALLEESVEAGVDISDELGLVS